MRINLVGAFIRNAPFGTELAFKRGFDRIGEHLVNIIDTSQPAQIWDYEADATIVFKWMEGYWGDLALTSGKKIVYQPDDVRFPHIKQMMSEMRRHCDYALTFDETGAHIANEFGYLKSEKLLLTADDELYINHPSAEKVADFCFIGSLTGGANHISRANMCNILRKNGFNVVVASDVYNISAIVSAYNQSKIILNHATDVGQEFGHGYGYQCRHFEAGFTKACVLSNHVDGVKELKNFMEFSSEQDLLKKAAFLISSDSFREKMANDFYAELNESHRPEHRAKQLIDFIGSL